MGDLPVGSTWGSFQIDRLLGESPPSSVYRAVQISGGRVVGLRVFNDGLEETALIRFEDDARRLVGFSHPNVLRIEGVGREGRRRFIVTEYFEALSLRDLGPRPLREGCEILLKTARGLGAAWMRLILHRNLKPENILISARGEVKVADFGLFQEPTPYWSPERRAGRSPDMRSDLYSLGTIFQEFLRERDPEIDALLHHLTRVEPFDRVQMVEDVISRVETYLSRTAAPTVIAPPPPAPVPVPPIQIPVLAPLPPLPPPWERELETPELREARASMVRTLATVAHRLPRSLPHLQATEDIGQLFDLPAISIASPKPAQPRLPRAPDPSPTPIPAMRPAPARSGVRFVPVLMILALAGFFYFRVQHAVARRREIAEETARLEEKRRREPPPTPPKPAVVVKIWDDDAWARARKTIQALDGEMKFAEASAACDQFVLEHGVKSPPESRTWQRTLKEWSSSVEQAERARKSGQDARALDLLDRGGAARAKDKERILARWCEEDWTKTVQEVAKSDPSTAQAALDRFLKKAHQGGAHRQEAETRKRALDADAEFADVSSRVNTLLNTRRESAAIEALEAFLALPHRGGAHREEIEKKIAQIREEARLTLYSARPQITRMAVSPGGTRIAFVSEGLRVMNPESREAVWTQPPKSLIRQVLFGGETLLASVQSTRITLWDVSTQKEVRALAPAESYFAFAALTPNGKQAVAIQSDGSLMTWDLDKDEPGVRVKSAAGGAASMALHPGGRTLAIGLRDKTLRIREVSSDRERTWTLPGAPATTLAWSPDGKRLASAGPDDAITVWDVEKGEALHTLQGHPGGVNCVAFSPNGAVLASGGADKTIRLWSAKDGSGLGAKTGHRERVTVVGWLADGGLVSASADGTVRTWPPKK